MSLPIAISAVVPKDAAAPQTTPSERRESATAREGERFEDRLRDTDDRRSVDELTAQTARPSETRSDEADDPEKGEEPANDAKAAATGNAEMSSDDHGDASPPVVPKVSADPETSSIDGSRLADERPEQVSDEPAPQALGGIDPGETFESDSASGAQDVREAPFQDMTVDDDAGADDGQGAVFAADVSRPAASADRREQSADASSSEQAAKSPATRQDPSLSGLSFAGETVGTQIAPPQKGPGVATVLPAAGGRSLDMGLQDASSASASMDVHADVAKSATSIAPAVLEGRRLWAASAIVAASPDVIHTFSGGVAASAAEAGEPLLRVDGVSVAARVESAPTSAAPIATPSTSVPAPVQQTVAVLARIADGDTELRLDPPELGRVRVSIASTDAGVVATVIAERPEVADMMRRHADALTRALEAAGGGSVDLRFGGEGGQAWSDDRSDGGPASGDVGDASGTHVVERSVRVRVDGLDLRV